MAELQRIKTIVEGNLSQWSLFLREKLSYYNDVYKSISSGGVSIHSKEVILAHQNFCFGKLP